MGLGGGRRWPPPPRKGTRRASGTLWHNRPVLEQLRATPNGVRLFLVYGLAVLALIGVALPGVIGLAVETPVTGAGITLMLLLAYTIFTLTLVLQRKRVAF